MPGLIPFPELTVLLGIVPLKGLGLLALEDLLISQELVGVEGVLGESLTWLSSLLLY